MLQIGDSTIAHYGTWSDTVFTDTLRSVLSSGAKNVIVTTNGSLSDTLTGGFSYVGGAVASGAYRGGAYRNDAYRGGAYR